MGKASRDKEWRVVPSLPHYEISEFGDLRRSVPGRTRKVGHVVRGQIVGGYRKAKLMMCDGSKKHAAIHRLVAETFIGPAPSSAHQVAHYDGDKTNNHYSNLRWATAKENAADRSRHGTTSFLGERNPKSKLSADQVRTIRAEFTPGYGAKVALMKKYKIGRTSLDYLLSGRNWSHV